MKLETLRKQGEAIFYRRLPGRIRTFKLLNGLRLERMVKR